MFAASFRTFALLAMLACAPAAFAHSYQQGDIQIGHIWARATAVGAKTGAVYVPLLNKGQTADKLVGVRTPVAEEAMLHESVKDNGVTRMVMLDDLPLEPGKPVAMRPGAKHIMLTGLKQQLKEGDKFPLTLTFEHAGAATVDVVVHGAGAASGDH